MPIRRATPADRDALYAICRLTGDNGRDATAKVHDPYLLGHIYAGPYLALEPEHALVLTDATDVTGYCLGAVHTTTFHKRQDLHWWPALREQYAEQLATLPDPALDPDYLDAGLLRLIATTPHAPAELVKGYPSHFHIDLLPQAQGKGFGRALVETLAASFQQAGSAGIHVELSSNNEPAHAFYGKLGFCEIGSANQNSILMGRKLK